VRSNSALVVNAPARRPKLLAYTHNALLKREVENICDEFSAVNSSKQKSVIARLSSEVMTPEGRSNRRQIQELKVTKSVLFQTFKLRFALSDFGSISFTTFNRFVPNWIREGKSRICLCVACQFTGEHGYLPFYVQLVRRTHKMDAQGNLHIDSKCKDRRCLKSKLKLAILKNKTAMITVDTFFQSLVCPAYLMFPDYELCLKGCYKCTLLIIISGIFLLI
jgi:hypothetical protein